MSAVTLDVAPELLADVIFVVSSCAKVVGSSECDGAVRLKLDAPQEIKGHCILVAERKEGAITYRLTPVVTN